MTAPVSVSCSKHTKSLTQTGLRSISGIGTDRRACIYKYRVTSGRQTQNVIWYADKFFNVIDVCVGLLAPLATCGLRAGWMVT